MHNLTQRPFRPAGRAFRLVDDRGRATAPDPPHSTPPGAGTPVAADAYGTVHLAYRVPLAATQLRLRFPTGPPDTPSLVDVPLGGA